MFLITIEAKIDEDPKQSFTSFNTNPLKISILIIDIIIKTQAAFKVTLMRCNQIKELMEELAGNIIRSF
jgi:hypothetical protein